MKLEKEKRYAKSIEWVKEMGDKFFVKFKYLNIPIEMTKSYYSRNFKQLQESN